MNNTTKMGERFPQKGMAARLELRFNPVNGSAGPAIGPLGPGARGFYIIVEFRYGAIWGDIWGEKWGEIRNLDALPCVVQAGRLQRWSDTV
jgi:hypothetical protein